MRSTTAALQASGDSKLLCFSHQMAEPPKPEKRIPLSSLMGSPKPIEDPALVAYARSALAAYGSSVPAVDIASVLQSVAKNPHDRLYKNQTIHLDGYVFTNCCFNDC